MADVQYGIIREQGDLMPVRELSEEDNKMVNENDQNKKDDSK